MIFYIGSSPKDAYMLPNGCNIMLNVAQFAKHGRLPNHNRPYRAYNRFQSLFLDSGGFVFFNRLGDYPFTVKQYASFIGRLQPHLFATMDYPCEPTITSSLNTWTIEQRIEQTTANATKLLSYFPVDIGPQPIPVIQGYTPDDYQYSIDLHTKAGTIRPYMAVGSMCARSNTAEITAVIRQVHAAATTAGVQRLHFFGLKLSPQLEPVRDLIHSRDSAAIYFAANKEIKASWNGKHFAPNRTEKQKALRHWLTTIEQRGYQYK